MEAMMLRLGGLVLIVALATDQAWGAGTATPSIEPQRDWKDTVTLIGAVVGAGLGLVNLGIGIWRERQRRGADGAYLAMRLAVVLEAYAAACSDLIYANRNAYQQHDQPLPDWDIGLPKMPIYPADDAGWKSIDPNTASECFGFENQIAESQDALSQVYEYNEDDLENAVRREACDRGLQAWSLAVKLRRAHGLKPVKTRSDYVRHLEREKRKDEELMAAERAQREADAGAILVALHEDKPS